MNSFLFAVFVLKEKQHVLANQRALGFYTAGKVQILEKFRLKDVKSS